MKKLRKSLSAIVMIMTVFSMLGFNASAAAPQAGDLIKMDGLSTVYFLGNDGKRYVYPTSSVYFSWHKDFSGVVTVSASELQSYPLGSNITMRPGTKLVKITTDPSVYAVEANGTLRKIQSEADAIAIYGANWAKRVVDVPDAFFTNYTIGTPLASGQVAAGTLVKNANSAAIYMYDGTNYRSIATEAAFNANRFDFANVITLSSAITAGGAAITGAEFAYDAQGGAGTGVVVTGSGLTVSLSAATPASASVIASQALVSLTSFNLTAANDGAVTVKSVKLKRTGISSDSSLTNVYLYEGNTRLTDAGSLSNGYVNFSASSLINVPAGQTKTITVKADIASGASTGNVGFAINEASDLVSTSAAISGSFPVSGNLMSLVSKPSDLATVTLSAGTMATSVKAGNTNVIIWSANTNVQSKAVDFKYLALKQIGSINIDDLSNYSLYVDGSKVATGVLTSNNDLVFDLANASRLTTGSHTIELKADIVKGSSRTFAFQMQTVANAVFTDTNYNVNVAPSAAISGTSYTISSGSVTTASDSTFSTTEVVKNASNVTLGKFTMKAWGEDVKINQLSATTTLTGTGSATSSENVNDLAIYVDGNQVGSSQSISLGTTVNKVSNNTFGTTNLFTIPAGKQVVVEIKGSLSLDTNTNISQIKADLGVGSAQGVTSYTTFNTSGVTGKSLNVVSGNLTVAKNSSVQNTNTSKNTSKVKIGSYIISAGSTEGVTVSNLRITLNASSTVIDNMSNLYVSENMTPIQPQSQNDFNVNLVIDKNQTKIVDVYADLGELSSNDVASTSLAVTYRTNATLTNGTGSANGQTVTIKTATLAVPTVVANTPAANFVLGGSTATAGTYKFVATDGNAYINEMTFTASTTFEGISQIIVDGVSAPVINGVAIITGLNKEIVAGTQGTNVEVKAVYNAVTSAGQGGVTSGKDLTVTLNGYKYTANGSQSTESGKTITAAAMRLVSAYPTVADASSYASKLLTPSGKSEVMRFTVTATGNNGINLNSIGLKASYDYNATSTGAEIVIEDASALGTNLATSSAVYGASGAAVGVAFANPVEIAKGTTKTFVVFADNTGSAVTGNYFRVDMVNSNWTWNDGTVSGSYPLNGTHVAEFTGTTFAK